MHKERDGGGGQKERELVPENSRSRTRARARAHTQSLWLHTQRQSGGLSRTRTALLMGVSCARYVYDDVTYVYDDVTYELFFTNKDRTVGGSIVREVRL